MCISLTIKCLILLMHGATMKIKPFNSLFAVRVLLRNAVRQTRETLLPSMILIVFMWPGILYYSWSELYLCFLAVCDVRTSHAVETYVVVCNCCILTFRHRSFSMQDRRFAILQRTLFMYLINKYISLSDICLTVHH